MDGILPITFGGGSWQMTKTPLISSESTKTKFILTPSDTFSSMLIAGSAK